MNKRILAACVAAMALVVLAIGGYLGYAQYQRKVYIEAIKPHVKQASLRTGNTLDLLVGGGKGVTYRELFERIDTDVAEIEKRVLEIQSISTAKMSEISDTALAYVRACQELLRTSNLLSRRRMAFMTAYEMENEALKNRYDSNPYVREMNERLASQAKQRADKASVEMEVAEADWIADAKKLKDLRAKAVEALPADSLVDVAYLDKVIATAPARVRSATTASRAPSSTIDISNNAIQSAILQEDTDTALMHIDGKMININAQNSDGNTALHLAVERGDERIVKALVHSGAKLDLANNRGETPTAVAKRANKPEMERLLKP